MNPTQDALAHDHHDPARWLARLHRLIDEQTDLALALDSLSRQQSRALAEGDAQSVLDVLAQREPIVAAMAEGARALEPFTDARAGPLAALPVDERASVRRRVARYREALERVRTRDDADRQALEAMRAAVGEELATMAVGRTVIGAYGDARSAPQPPAFQDRRA